MIRRLVLENFMSHARTVIELADGLTVLVGPNNCGKSAVVEALRTLCENDNGDDLIRHGADQCAVIVETDDGHTVAWRRKGTAVWYEIDGVKRDRLKGEVPENLHEILKLPKVSTGRDEVVDVHFGLQKSPVFLLHENASDRKAAAFFSSASDAEKLMQMQSRHREKVRAAKTTQRDMSRKLAAADALLERLHPLDEVGPGISELENEFASIERESKQLADLTGVIERIEATQAETVGRARRAEALAAIAQPPNLQDETALAQAIVQMRECETKSALAQASLQAIDTLEAAPAMDDTTPLARLIAEIQEQQGALQAHAAARKALDDLAELAPVLDLAPLKNCIAELTSASDAASRCTVEARQCAQALESCEAEIREYLAENPTCPLCGGAIDAESLFDTEHAHA